MSRRTSENAYRLFAPELAEISRRGGASAGLEVALPAGEAHHALHVLRLSCGDRVELFGGDGSKASGVIAAATKRQVTVTVEQFTPPAGRVGPTVHLAFAVPKGNRLDWLLEKATELGAASLQPVIFNRSVAGGEELGENKFQRWMGHCISAANGMPR